MVDNRYFDIVECRQQGLNIFVHTGFSLVLVQDPEAASQMREQRR